MDQIANTISLSVVISILNPLQLIKSRYQTMNELMDKGNISRSYKGLKDCFKNIVESQGVKSLWKGNSMNLVRFFPNEQINFSIKSFSQSLLPEGGFFNIVSGVIGGWTAASILYPIDTFRLLLSLSPENYKITTHEISRKIQREGIKFLYRGFSSCLISIAIFRGSMFGFYDTFKNNSNSLLQKWTIAYSTGLVSGMIVYPIETVRKRKIASKQQISEIALLKKIVQKEGLKALYHGCSLTPIQSLAGSAILIYFDRTSKK